MDERLVVDGEIADLKGAFYDASLMPLEEWKRKQLGYAKREARQAFWYLCLVDVCAYL